MKVFYVLSVFMFIILVTHIFSYSTRNNLNVKNSKIMRIHSWLIPQGWGFFTKDIREEYLIDLLDDKGDKLMMNNTHYSNFFGFSKKGKKLNMEVSIINSKIPDSLWTNIKDMPNKINRYRVDNEHLHYLKNGQYILTRHKITPYLWRNLPNIDKKQIVYVETNEN